jgi:hypothetical protein
LSFNIQLWGVENGLLAALPKERLDTEDRLEQWIADDVSLLGLDLLIIGRQVRTSSGGKIDLLAIDQQGDLVILELKRDRTPREVVAQALDYASWVDRLLAPQIAEFSLEYLKQPLAEAFRERFETPLPDAVNKDHRIVIVASELDDSSERIVQYLANRRSMNINVVFFSCFRQGENELVGRAWLQDPEEIEERSEGTKAFPWSGDWYVNINDTVARNWEDCMKYGFVSAGWGTKFRRHMCRLMPGSKLFVYLPRLGYVGYGTVVSEACPAKDFTPVGYNKKLLDLPHTAEDPGHDGDDLDQCEWIVGVKWHTKFPRDQCKRFDGAFSSPHVVCKLRDQRTLDFLRREFNVSEWIAQTGGCRDLPLTVALLETRNPTAHPCLIAKDFQDCRIRHHGWTHRLSARGAHRPACRTVPGAENYYVV